MACPTRFELVIFRVGVGCIIQLCYGQVLSLAERKKQCFGIPYSIIIIKTFLSNKIGIIYVLTFLYKCNKIRANEGYITQYK